MVTETYFDTRLLFEFLDLCGSWFTGTSQPFDKVPTPPLINVFPVDLCGALVTGTSQVDLKWEAYNLQIINVFLMCS